MLELGSYRRLVRSLEFYGGNANLPSEFCKTLDGTCYPCIKSSCGSSDLKDHRWVPSAFHGSDFEKVVWLEVSLLFQSKFLDCLFSFFNSYFSCSVFQ